MKKPFLHLYFLLAISVFLLTTNCAKSEDSNSEPKQSNETLPPPVPPEEPVAVVEKNENDNFPKVYSEAVARNIENLSRSTQAPHNSSYSTVIKRCLSKDCQNKFVSIIIASPEGTFTCSGVPLAKNIVLTNFHCINQLAFDPSKNVFTAGIYIQPPTYKTQFSLAVRAKKVVAHSPMNFYNSQLMGHPYAMDYAILELESDLEITPPKINYTYGLNDGENYTVLEFSPYAASDFDEKRTLREYKCKAIHNSIYAPAVKSKSFPISFFSDCPIGPGNSGSPIYNSKGELVGIISGQFNPMRLDYLSVFSNEFGILKSRLKNVGWGNMLTCIPKIENGIASPVVGSECDNELSSIASKNSTSLSQKKINEMESYLAKSRTQNSLFRFTPSRLNITRSGFLYMWALGLVVADVPECIYKKTWEHAPQTDELILKAVSPMLGIYGQYQDQLFGFNFPTYIKFEDLQNLQSGGQAKLKIFSGITGNLKSDPASISKPYKHDPKQLFYSSAISFCD